MRPPTSLRVSSSSLRRVTATVAVAVVTGGLGAAVAASPAAAEPVGSTPTSEPKVLLEESFDGYTAPNFVLPADPYNVNTACLSKIPYDYYTGEQDPSYSYTGWNGRTTTSCWESPYGGYWWWGYDDDRRMPTNLQLTPPYQSLAGGAFLDGGLATDEGLDITVDSYQWGGNWWGSGSADGLTVALAAADPDAPTAPIALGALGAGLGYAPIDGRQGLTNGYLAAGMDVIGSFSRNGFGMSTTCAPSEGAGRQSVTVRGPGNGTDRYCVISTTPSSGSLNQPDAYQTPTDSVPVQFSVNPSGKEVTNRAGDTVPAHSWLVGWTAYGADRQTSTGALPTAADMAAAGIDPSWYDAETGMPKKVSLGFTAGTGSYAEFHAVNNLKVTTLSPATPEYSLSAQDSVDGAVTAGGGGTLTVTPSVKTAGEGLPATVVATFPAGLVPTAPVTEDYACEVDGQVVTCVHTAGGTLAGADLPALVIPFTADNSGVGVRTVTVSLSSDDSQGATTSHEVTVTGTQAITFEPLDSPAPVGTSVALSATGGASQEPVTFTVGGPAVELPVEHLPVEEPNLPNIPHPVVRASEPETGTTTPEVCAIEGTTLTYRAEGTCVVTAHQGAGEGYAAAPDVTHEVAVQRVVTGTTVTLSAPTAVRGTPVTATATVLGGEAGAVQFTVDEQPFGAPVTLVAGKATSAALTDPEGKTLAVGTHQVGAAFVPADGTTYAGSAAVAPLTVGQAGTTTTVVVSATTLTATVKTVVGHDPATGSVTFSVDGKKVGDAPLVDGVATLAYATPADHTRNVAATYGGSSEFLGSAGSTARSNPVINAKISAKSAKSGYGWYRTPVTVTFSCKATSAELVSACPTPVVFAKSGTHSLSRSVLAADGGVATVSLTGIRVDSVAPSVAVKGVKSGARYFASAPKVTCAATDAVSGIASCTVTRKVSGTTHTYTAKAVDRAGNTSTRSVAVTVSPIVLDGAAYTGGAYSVTRGKTYTLLVSSVAQPRYVNAAKHPVAPRGQTLAFQKVGKNTWALGVTMDRGMTPGLWSLGVKVGSSTTKVPVRVR